MRITKNTLAIIIACHNRRETTLACLASLVQNDVENIDAEIFLMDDGSTDGTSEAVKAKYPKKTDVDCSVSDYSFMFGCHGHWRFKTGIYHRCIGSIFSRITSTLSGSVYCHPNQWHPHYLL